MTFLSIFDVAIFSIKTNDPSFNFTQLSAPLIFNENSVILYPVYCGIHAFSVRGLSFHGQRAFIGPGKFIFVCLFV